MEGFHQRMRQISHHHQTDSAEMEQQYGEKRPLPEPMTSCEKQSECPDRRTEKVVKKKPKLDKVTDMAKQLGIPMTLVVPRQAGTIVQEGRKKAERPSVDTRSESPAKEPPYQSIQSSINYSNPKTDKTTALYAAPEASQIGKGYLAITRSAIRTNQVRHREKRTSKSNPKQLRLEMPTSRAPA